jgi:hypothetical protein
MPGFVAYYGGRVISNVAVVAVFWTANVDVTVQQRVGSFYAAVTNSSYLDWLSEYDTVGRVGSGGQGGSEQHIGRGRFVGAFTIEPATSDTALDNDQIATELAAQIAAGSLPAPSLDAAGNVNSLYVVEMPPGYVVTLLGAKSCSAFCSYHWTASIGGHSVPYVVLPDMHGCAGAACGQGFDDETILRSHEIAEAITDTESGMVDPADFAAGRDVYPMAWSADGGAKSEIADLCFSAFQGDHDTVAGYAVQKLWSNYAGKCVVGVPICDGATQPPSCRECTHYDDGAACSGEEPVCDEDTGRCRACEGSECPADPDAGVGADTGASASAGAGAGAAVDADAGGGGSVGTYRARGGGCASAGAGLSTSALDGAIVALSLWSLARRRRLRGEARA